MDASSSFNGQPPHLPPTFLDCYPTMSSNLSSIADPWLADSSNVGGGIYLYPAMVDLAFTNASHPQQAYSMRFLFLYFFTVQTTKDSLCQLEQPYTMKGGDYDLAYLSSFHGTLQIREKCPIIAE